MMSKVLRAVYYFIDIYFEPGKTSYAKRLDLLSLSVPIFDLSRYIFRHEIVPEDKKNFTKFFTLKFKPFF